MDREPLSIYNGAFATTAGPRDADVSFYEVGAVYVVNPTMRWIGELGAGIGWAKKGWDLSSP